MIQRLTLIVFIALFALSFSFAADQKAQDKNTAASVAAQSSKLTGVIDKVDLTAKTISFRADDSKQLQEISFSESSVFHKDNATLKPEDLKKGDRVAIEVDSTNTITTLEFQPAAGSDQAQNKQ